MKKALITGITGQDGSFLAELLLEKGYEVHGLRRPSAISNLRNIVHLIREPYNKKFFLHYGDLTDSSNLKSVIENIKPDEIYNLGAQSHVHVSFQVPEYTAEVNSLGLIKILETIKTENKNIKFYQASTSELYGQVLASPQNEETPFNPVSPYAISKLYSYFIVKNYRDAYNLFSTNGILFNHESERRGLSFVTRKITTAVSDIYHKREKRLFLGNLDSERDWGYAKEYVEAMWLMLQHEDPEDFVIASGQKYSVREFVTKSFKVIDIDIIWEGREINEKGINKKTGEILVEIDPYYFRPVEVDHLLGDCKKAEKLLGWKPKTSIDQLVEIMVEHDLKNHTLL